MDKDIYLYRCGGCGVRNKIPADRIGVPATCGKCKAPMDTGELRIDQPVVVTDGLFAEKVLRSPLPVLVDCWAPWCGPCRMMEPVMNELAREWKGRVRVCKLNIDENPQIAQQFQIQSVPTLLVFDRGVLQDSLLGALPRQQILMKMAAYL